jgi:predicted metal-dependent hydrolase
LAELGYPTHHFERLARRSLRLRERLTPARSNLAATAALEHYTATFAEVLLGDDEFNGSFGDENVRNLFVWHALEESEHKAVAFDVYRAAGGPYPERAALMVLASLVFWSKVLEHQVRLMAADGTAGDPAEWARLVRFLFIEPGGMLTLVPAWFDSFRPGFHPWDLDNEALLRTWSASVEAVAA